MEIKDLNNQQKFNPKFQALVEQNMMDEFVRQQSAYQRKLVFGFALLFAAVAIAIPSFFYALSFIPIAVKSIVIG